MEIKKKILIVSVFLSLLLCHNFFIAGYARAAFDNLVILPTDPGDADKDDTGLTATNLLGNSIEIQTEPFLVHGLAWYIAYCEDKREAGTNECGLTSEINIYRIVGPIKLSNVTIAGKGTNDRYYTAGPFIVYSNDGNAISQVNKVVNYKTPDFDSVTKHKVTSDLVAGTDFTRYVEVKAKKICISNGSYDNVTPLFDKAKIPYDQFFPATSPCGDNTMGDSHDIYIFGCANNYLSSAINGLQNFVDDGGIFFFNDWTLRNYIKNQPYTSVGFITDRITTSDTGAGNNDGVIWEGSAQDSFDLPVEDKHMLQTSYKKATNWKYLSSTQQVTTIGADVKTLALADYAGLSSEKAIVYFPYNANGDSKKGNVVYSTLHIEGASDTKQELMFLSLYTGIFEVSTLYLTASPDLIDNGIATDVTFTVKDDSANPIDDVRIQFDGVDKDCTNTIDNLTNSSGECDITVPPTTTDIDVTASKIGYIEATMTLKVFDFSLSAMDVSMNETDTKSSTITVGFVPSGSLKTITLSADLSSVTGASESFSGGNTVSNCSPSCSKDLNITTSSTPAGTYIITVTGTSDGGLSKTDTFTLTVTSACVPSCPGGCADVGQSDGCVGNCPDNEGTSCDDGDPCTSSDVCSGGYCVGTPNACDSGADGCCPPGCSYTAGDMDCPICNKNKVCESGETFDTCPEDCGWGIYYTPFDVQEDLEEIVMSITNWILGFISLIAVLAIIWGGVNYIGAVGDEDKIEKAKKIITYAVIGLVIAGIAYAVVYVIAKVLLK